MALLFATSFFDCFQFLWYDCYFLSSIMMLLFFPSHPEFSIFYYFPGSFCSWLLLLNVSREWRSQRSATTTKNTSKKSCMNKKNLSRSAKQKNNGNKLNKLAKNHFLRVSLRQETTGKRFRLFFSLFSLLYSLEATTLCLYVVYLQSDKQSPFNSIKL